MTTLGTPKRLALTAAATAAVAMVAASCTTSSPSDASGTPAAGSGTSAGAPATDTIRTSFMADPTSFSPFVQRGIDDTHVDALLFDTLVHLDGNSVVGGLASSWKISPKVGTFTIRKGATCDDGSAITPSVVAASLKIFVSPKVGSPFVGQVFGQAPSSITANDKAGTVTIKLAKPWADMLTGLAKSVTGIVCAPGLKDPAALQKGKVAGAYSGPYTLTSAKRGVSYTFTLRDDYHGWPKYKTPVPGTPAKTIDFTVTANQTTLTNQLLTGGQDIGVVTGSDSKRLDGKPGFTTKVFPQASMYLMFNQRSTSPFQDVKTRKAVAASVNQAGFNQAVSGGRGEVQTSIALPATQCANTDKSALVPFSPDTANADLKGVKIRLLGSQSFGPNGAAGSYVAAALRAAGADVRLQNVDNGTWVTQGTQQVGSWDLTFMAATWTTMYNYIASVTGTPVEKGGLNWTGNVNQAVNSNAIKAEGQASQSQRCATFGTAEKSLIKNADVVPLSTLPSQVTARDGFSLKVFGGTADYYTLRITG